MKSLWFTLVAASIGAGCHSVDGAPLPPPAVPLVTELDVDGLLGWFGAPVPGQPALMPIDDARRVVEDFKSGTAFRAFPAGNAEETWFGKSYLVYADGTSSEAFQFLRFKKGRGLAAGVDAAAVLPWLACTNGLQTDGGSEEADADDLFTAAENGAAPRPESGALRYVREAECVDGYGAIVASAGVSQVVVQADRRWMRMSGKRLLLIQRIVQFSGLAKNPSHIAGRYSELWKLP